MNENDENILAVSYSIFDESEGTFHRRTDDYDEDKNPFCIKVEGLTVGTEARRMGVYELMEKNTCETRRRWMHMGMMGMGQDIHEASVLYYCDKKKRWGFLDMKWTPGGKFDNSDYAMYSMEPNIHVTCEDHTPVNLNKPWTLRTKSDNATVKVSVYTAEEERRDEERAKYLISDARVLRIKIEHKMCWIITKRSCCQYMLRLGLQLTLRKVMCNKRLLGIVELPLIPDFVLPVFGEFDRRNPLTDEMVTILQFLTKKYDLVANEYEYVMDTHSAICTMMTVGKQLHEAKHEAKHDAKHDAKQSVNFDPKNPFAHFKSNYLTDCNHYKGMNAEHGFPT